jgi:hypothetical protein
MATKTMSQSWAETSNSLRQRAVWHAPRNSNHTASRCVVLQRGDRTCLVFVIDLTPHILSQH